MKVLLWTVSVVIALLVRVTESADNYETRFCYCNLDSYLKQNLLILLNQQPVTNYILATDPPTTPGPVLNATDMNATDLNVSRRKRQASSFSEIDLKLSTSTDGVIHPKTGKVVFDNSVEISETYGVYFSKNYKFNKCECTYGSTIKLEVCLTRLSFSDSMKDKTLNSTKSLWTPLLEHLSMTLTTDEAMKDKALYKRAHFTEFTEFEDLLKIKRTAAIFKIKMRKVEFLSGHYIMSALLPSLTSTKPTIPKKFGDQEVMSDCISYEDITPPEVVVRDPTWYLRFLTIPIALGILALIILCTCCRNNAFYVRFW